MFGDFSTELETATTMTGKQDPRSKLCAEPCRNNFWGCGKKGNKVTQELWQAQEKCHKLPENAAGETAACAEESTCEWKGARCGLKDAEFVEKCKPVLEAAN